MPDRYELILDLNEHDLPPISSLSKVQQDRVVKMAKRLADEPDPDKRGEEFTKFLEDMVCLHKENPAQEEQELREHFSEQLPLALACMALKEAGNIDERRRKNSG